MKQSDIVHYCDQLLDIGLFRDYCPNGLQVEGDDRNVKTIATGVSISLALIEKAVSAGADMIITHHGLFWDKDERIIRGPMRQKLQRLLESGIAAAAYHLPLDFHPELGNNAQLADRIGLKDLKPFAEHPKYAEGIIGRPEHPDIRSLSERIFHALSREPMVVSYGPEKINSVAIVTGGAQGHFLEAIDAGADCFITGEISERNYTMSREYGVHFISAGHYSTEKFGIDALGRHLENELGISAVFIDIPNPI